MKYESVADISPHYDLKQIRRRNYPLIKEYWVHETWGVITSLSNISIFEYECGECTLSLWG